LYISREITGIQSSSVEEKSCKIKSLAFFSFPRHNIAVTLQRKGWDTVENRVINRRKNKEHFFINVSDE